MEVKVPDQMGGGGFLLYVLHYVCAIGKGEFEKMLPYKSKSVEHWKSESAKQLSSAPTISSAGWLLSMLGECSVGSAAARQTHLASV